LINDNIEDLTELGLWSLERIKENKAKVARAYIKKVRLKEFQVEDLVREAVLPLGTKDAAYGKWSPNWHGPYRIDQVLSKMHICLRSWTVSSSQWLSTVSISRSIFLACGMTDIEQPMIRIRLYREGGDTWNRPIIKKEKKEKKKGKKEYKKKEKRRHMYNSR
jgi:hypothetical protein